MPQSRQLAAIMFTDIVGYTALMSKDEELALGILKRSRSIQQEQVNAFNGSWLKEMGDGALVKFNSAKDAVLCAIAIQQQAHIQLDAQIRIGIHLGDVTIENNDIFGDGVNVASRLQSSADPGGIYISDSVFKAVQATPSINTKYLGHIAYKNVDYPVSTYAIQGKHFPIASGKRLPKKDHKRFNNKFIISLILILAISGFYIWKFFGKQSELKIESVAVLPFENLTNNEGNDVLIAGMHDALISELGRINTLRIISKTSTLRYKNTNSSLTEIAQELNVDAIVEASVFSIDTLINLQAKLVKIFPEEQNIWSGTVTRDFNHVLEIYRTIAYNIVDEIKISLKKESKDRLVETIIINPDAYKAYLYARQYLGSLSKEGLDKASEYLQVSIKHDPDYAPAYGGMAFVWAYRQQMGFASRDEAVPEIETYLNTAFSLDSTQAESYYRQAVVEAWTHWNWMKAEVAFQKALSINPNLAEAHAFYSHLLMCLKRPVEMKMHMDQAVKIDPYNPLIQVLKGIELSMTKQSDKAIEHFTPLDKLAPNNTLVQIGMWMAYHVQGNKGKAFNKQKRILQLVCRDNQVIKIFEDTYASAGYEAALSAAADSWTKRSGLEFVPPDYIFWMYGASGEVEKTLEWLKIGYEMHDSNMPYIAILPVFSNIQDNSEYLNLLEKLNLPID